MLMRFVYSTNKNGPTEFSVFHHSILHANQRMVRFPSLMPEDCESPLEN